MLRNSAGDTLEYFVVCLVEYYYFFISNLGVLKETKRI